jgi:uncharacterized UPF0160 family protein
MGTDIHGWVEVRPLADEPEWYGVINAGLLVGRDYDTFGCLFGVKNYAGFVPLAAGRGLPEDASAEVRAVTTRAEGMTDGEYAAAVHSASWIAWSELTVVDWDELAPVADRRIHEYERDPTGRLVYRRKAAWSPPLAEATGLSVAEALLTPRVYPEGAEWEIDGVVYRAERLRRRDALDEDWQLLFDLMARLARRYSDERVRLVVWFAS